MVEELKLARADKIDLLFVVDNSLAMADKQVLLRDAVPQLVNGLVNPQLDPVTGQRAFAPIADVHIGIVSSSLGGHGADICSPVDSSWNPTKDDRGHLIGLLRPDVFASSRTYSGQGFLAWDPTANATPPGEADASRLVADFQDMVQATGETGCGFEAPLEAWYRFLIDPNPPLRVVNTGNSAEAEGSDAMLLAQRRAFLRHDSVVLVVMLTDENDCSVVDGGIGWLSAQAIGTSGRPFHLPRATSACASDPNDACCRSCADQAAAPAGCTAVASDPACQDASHDDVSDPLNLRCWDQKRRFGVDFLYPTSRYVQGLTNPTVHDARTATEQPNPLFAAPAGAMVRNRSLVFLAGIVGVPWQDIATAETLNDATNLEYRRAESINWDWIVGDVNLHIKPMDPLMHEQPEPRSGTNPATKLPLAPATSTDPQANPINGHEYITSGWDLQYACIFDIPDRDCSQGGGACDCSASDLAANKPLCQPPGGGEATTMQYWAKAYPGLRHLQVLKDFGQNSIVASACPKLTTGDPGAPGYGYNPAVRAILDRLKDPLGPKCLPRSLAVDEDPSSPTFGGIACDVLEASPSCLCDTSRGRTEVASNDPMAQAARAKLVSLGVCGEPCNDYCLCRIEQLTGDARASCQTDPIAETPGYCYVDADQGIGSAEFVAACPAAQRRILRFGGGAEPNNSAVVLLACPAS